MNYTKGQWYIDKELTDKGAPIIVSDTCWTGRKRQIAKVLYHIGSEDPEVQANARRICQCVNSHDALMEACERYVRMQDEINQEMGRKPTNTMYNMMKAAIKK